MKRKALGPQGKILSKLATKEERELKKSLDAFTKALRKSIEANKSERAQLIKETNKMIADFRREDAEKAGQQKRDAEREGKNHEKQAAKAKNDKAEPTTGAVNKIARLYVVDMLRSPVHSMDKHMAAEQINTLVKRGLLPRAELERIIHEERQRLKGEKQGAR